MSAAYDRIVDALRANNRNVIERGTGSAKAQCPAHLPDNNPSLSIYPRKDGNGSAVKCYTGCDQTAILDALGLTWRDLYDEPQIRQALNPDRSYRYSNGDTKSRRGTGPDKKMNWSKKGQNGGGLLYGVEHLRPDDETVYLCEGESAAEMLRAMAVAAVATGGSNRKPDMTPLADKDVIAVVDRDTAGLTWARWVHRKLTSVAKSVQFMQAAIEVDKADVVDHLGADLSLDDLVPINLDESDDDTRTDRQAAAPKAEPVQPVALTAAHQVFRKWLGQDYDTDALDAELATLAVEKFEDGSDPIWLLLISGSGNAKTEAVAASAGAGAVITSSIASDAALLSATPKRERAKNATGGLLRLVGDRGVLAIKDVTSILSMNRDLRAKVLAALREVYDGRWCRDVGTDGGYRIEWDGRIAVIGAVTTAWDTAHSVVSAMGDRFVLIRIDSTEGRTAAGRQAIGNTGSEPQMRAELSAAVAGVIAGMNTTPTTVASEEIEILLAAADLVTLARTAVEFDYQGKVIDAHAPEMPTRFAKQLTQVVRGGVAVGMDRADALRLAIRCARDSMPPLRLAIIEDLAVNPDSSPSDVRRRINKPWSTVDRQLQALHMLGIADVDEVHMPGDKKNRWFYSLQPGIDAKTIHSPEMSVNTPKPPVEKEAPTQELIDSPRICTNKSGEWQPHADQDTAAPNGQAPSGFSPPTGPGRCDDCGYHIDTMGHRDTCPANDDIPF